MKILTSTLSIWSKKEYGNIFSSVVNFEEQLKVAEEDVIQHNTKENRTKLHLIHAQYIKYLKLEASIRKQKTQFRWFKEGDTNSKTKSDTPTNAKPGRSDSSVFSMNRNSVAGSNGLGGKFYQHCWEIIKEDVLSAVQYFFCGYTMPKFIFHACLFLRAKYCQRAHPVAKKLDTGQSLVWNFMVKNKGIFEAQIKWKINSAWELIRYKGIKNIINKGIWHRHLPFKTSFLVWRALRSKLPTNEKLTSFGKEAAHCSCCYRPGEDNVDHIFITGHFANNIWSSFYTVAGIQHDHIPINMLLLRWWRQEHKSEVQNLLNQLLYLIIIWNLWKNRCAAKYGSKQSNTARVKYLIFKDTTHLLNTAFPYIQWANNWNDFFRMVENCRQETMLRIVKWKKPSQPLLKLNTDGSALSNPGNIGGGGILRDHQGG
ncbi:hypothetical protein MTR67_039020 [Solanum verrucosum]|uniref:Reverse transcriptase zinc-binding domain-containing protein n=1 Tax=Solanum verrucosum TaxID=315347 RepID=A0AAF0ZQ92_SOLVR|nr:hypothetical protein MTR67_039020 [Solanum verrucosum]